MKIGIITHPLESNYGGILQNYALQQTLIKLGHEPITIDYHPRLPIINLIRYNLKNIYLRLLKKQRRPFLINHKTHKLFVPFVHKHIQLSQYQTKLRHKFFKELDLSAVIVGSDQVWSVKYGQRLKLEDMFLRFLSKDETIRKIAYAASFGTKEWTLDTNKTTHIKSLTEKFYAISVREKSGIKICKEYLNCDAVHALDPTLLLKANDYNRLIPNDANESEYILAYILDSSPERINVINNYASKVGLKVKFVSAHDDVKISIEQWLSMFKNASHIMTDSFHGMVFSIIYHKNFSCFINSERGAERFESILSMLKLENRIITANTPIDTTTIDWENVDIALQKARDKSIDFLKDSLK